MTGAHKLSYVGYSQGTTQMLTALAYNYGNLQTKVNISMMLAPVAIMGNVTIPALKLASHVWWLML